MFFKISGGNGATFFFSAASFADWKKSLEFYQGVSFVAKVKKFLLTAAYPLFLRKAKMTGEEVAAEVQNLLPEEAKITVGGHDSAMISPTRDKAILHHHGRSYEKFAFGDSRAGAVRELELYQQLQAVPPKHFVASKLLKFEVNEKLVHFEMAYPAPKGCAETIPLEAYAEFFNLKREADTSWSALWPRLQLPFEVTEADKAGTTPVGLVHYDFKPWNVKLGKVPHFFDFESAAPGLPLEDFFNYFVDPALHFGSARECLHEMREQERFETAEKLLALQGIDPQEVGRYWRWYLLERYDFFMKKGASQLAAKFLELYRLPVKDSAQPWKNFFAVTGIMLAALALRLYYAAVHPLQGRDATGYLMLIQRWFTEGGGDDLSIRPPLFCYLARALMFCGLEVETAALAVNMTAGTLMVLACYLAGRAIWKRRSAGIMAALLCAVMPNLIKFSCCALRDGLYLGFSAWSIALWAMAIRVGREGRKRGYLWSVLCGIAIAAGCMCRFEMALFLPFAAASLFIVPLMNRAPSRAFCMTLTLMIGVACGFMLLTMLPGMPDVVPTYVDRLRMATFSWKIWGLR